MKHVLIVNPVSGTRDVSGTVIPEFKSLLNEQDCCVEITQRRGHATQIVKSYAESGEAVRFYACGGDGTLNEVLQGSYGFENCEVASLPYGSGNDFIRNFGERFEFQSIVNTISGSTVVIDLMRANNGISAAISSVGIDADVAYGIPAFRRLPLCGGHMAYNLSIVKALCKRLGREMLIELDNEFLKGNYLIATVCNGTSYGGGFNAAPCADVTDGMLDVILVKKISRFRIASVLARYKKGEHILNGEVISELQDAMQYIRAKNVKITPIDKKPIVVNVDGECGVAQGLDIQVIPMCARFVLPKTVYERFKIKALAL